MRRGSTTAKNSPPISKAAFGGIYIAYENFTPEAAEETLAAGEADAVAFRKQFIANADLPRRIALYTPPSEWNPTTFSAEGAAGYTDYPVLAAAAD